MRHFHYLEVEHFKRFGDKTRVELGHLSVLVGPNNCGKTSLIQALSLWSQAGKMWTEEMEGSGATVKTGRALNRLNILTVPVAQTRHFWRDLKVRSKLRITVGFEHGGKTVPLTMELTHHQSDELVYCKLVNDTAATREALKAAAGVDVALLYPMSGIASDEAVVLPERVAYLLGRGSTAEVLRNLCLAVMQHDAGEWEEIVAQMERLFHVRLQEPRTNARGTIDLEYKQEGVNGLLDVSLAGRGFQQFLLLFAYLYRHTHSVLLVDEPDAHLELLRQRQAYVLLRDLAARQGSQVVFVTHSEVVLQEAVADREQDEKGAVSLLVGGRATPLGRTQEALNALKHYGAVHQVRAQTTGHVFYVEGETDVALLTALAERLGHPAAALLREPLNVYYTQDNYPEATTTAERALERVEGAFGERPQDHFFAIRSLVPDLVGFVLRDGDGTSREAPAGGGLTGHVWERYETENYVVTPERLRAYVLAHAPEPQRDPAVLDAILDELTQERVFKRRRSEFETYQNADPAARRLLWTARTSAMKLSDFAETFFRRLHERTQTPMALRKGTLHELVAFADPAEIDSEVTQVLDAIQQTFTSPPPAL